MVAMSDAVVGIRAFHTWEGAPSRPGRPRAKPQLPAQGCVAAAEGCWEGPSVGRGHARRRRWCSGGSACLLLLLAGTGEATVGLDQATYLPDYTVCTVAPTLFSHMYNVVKHTDCLQLLEIVVANLVLQ